MLSRRKVKDRFRSGPMVAGAARRNIRQDCRSASASRLKLNLMTYDDLRLLIDYNYWARDRVLDALATITPEQFIRPMGNSFKSVRDTVAHICAAERIWITRLKGENPQGFQEPDRLRDVDAARKEWAELEERCAINSQDWGRKLRNSGSSIRTFAAMTNRTCFGRCCSTWSITAPIIADRSPRCCDSWTQRRRSPWT